MKIRGLFKKAAATLMAAVTALSILPATTAFAAGDIGTISFSHTYDSSGNAMRYNSSATFDGHTAGGTGNYKYRMFVDGENAFCIQPGVPLNTGNTLKKASSDTWNALSANQKKAVGLALLYGYQGNRSNLTGSDDEKWVATQTLVWEFVTGCREATGSFSKTSDKVYSLHFGSNYANSGAKAAYDQIVSLMSGHHTIPSFMSGSKNGITKELAYKDGKYTLTFTDSNGVLSDYAFSSSDSKVSVSKSGNKLTISSAKAFDGTVRITATRNNMPIVSSSAKLIAYGDPNLQDLVTGVENADTVAAYINVETPTGTIALKKTSEDGIVELVSDKSFAKEIKKRFGVQTDTSKIDKELANYESKLKEVDLNKARLEREIDNLPADAKYRERKIHDMTIRLDGLYDTIVELEERIEDAKLRRSSIEMEAITLENVYRIMENFSKLYAIISDEEKKSLVSYLIKEIQIYPNGTSDRILKSIEFNFPIYRDGREIRKLLWENGNTVECVVMLER